VRPDEVTWLAIDANGKTHHVSPEDVMGATLELVADARVLHGLIVRLRDHNDPEVRRSLMWAYEQIADRSMMPVAPDTIETQTESDERPHSVVLFAFGIAALIGAFTAIGWIVSLAFRI